MKSRKLKVMIVLGTRPEAIKLAPVIAALKSRRAQFETVVVLTSQHKTMAAEILALFKIVPDVDLKISHAGQSPSSITTRTISKLAPVLTSLRADILVVQGDTTSAMAAALEAFYQHIPVAHVEAGLRTDDPRNPFPEEINRRIISQIASLHFAATPDNRKRLLREGAPAKSVIVTGNPVIDALDEMSRRRLPAIAPAFLRRPHTDARYILLTTHRRENFGKAHQEIFEAVNQIVATHPDIEIIFPVHPNPNVQNAVRLHLRRDRRIHCVKPMDYISFAHAIRQSYCVMTDSGGLQEEAPALGKPVIVLRDVTERQEIIASGNGILAGTTRDGIIKAVNSVLDNKTVFKRMSRVTHPFGTGGAAGRIADALSKLTSAG